MKQSQLGTIKKAFAAIGRRWNSADTWKNVPAVFVAIALIFGLVFAIKTPLLWGGDETTHFARAYQISQGQITPKKMAYPWGSWSYGGKLPVSVYNLIMHVNNDITTDATATAYGTHRIDYPASYAPFAGQKLKSPKVDYFFPNTASYSPAAYIPSVIAIWVALLANLNVGHTIILARLFTLAFYIACIWFALKSLKGTKFAWVVAAVALVPMTLFEASIICGDAVANALAILLISLVAKTFLGKDLTKQEFWVLAATTLLLPLVKPNYVFIALAVLLIPTVRLAKAHVPERTKLIVVGASVLAVGIWTFMVRAVSDAIKLIGTGPRWTLIHENQQLKYMIHNPVQFVEVVIRTFLLQDNNWFNGMFGQLSFDFIQVPAFSIVATLLAILIALGISERITLPRGKRWLTGGLVAAGVLSILATFYLTFSNVAEPIIEGVQGRYFLPFLLLALVAVLISKRKATFAQTDKQAVMMGRTIACLSFASLFFAAWKFFYVLF